MFEKHSSIDTPPNDLILWKYMELWKFLDIIDKKKLFMSRCDLFEDKLEGRVPNRNVERFDNTHPLKQVDKFSETTLKKSSYVSCWSSEQNETYPLWKVYSDYRSSIAIKTTIGSLIKSISQEKLKQYIGKVKYVKPKGTYDFHGNTFQLFFEKREYFIFEKEVRVLTELPFTEYNELLTFPVGLKIDIEPNVLIEEITLAPLADEAFKRLIELKLNTSNISAKVNYSDI